MDVRVKIFQPEILGVARSMAKVRGVNFRAPHYSCSSQGLLGELAISAGGILFLDNADEIPRPSLRLMLHNVAMMHEKERPIIFMTIHDHSKLEDTLRLVEQVKEEFHVTDKPVLSFDAAVLEQAKDICLKIKDDADTLTQILNWQKPEGFNIDDPSSPGSKANDFGNELLGRLDSVVRDLERSIQAQSRNEIFFIDMSGSMAPLQIARAFDIVRGRMKRCFKSCGAFTFDCRTPYEVGPYLPGPQAAQYLRSDIESNRNPHKLGGGSDAKPAIEFVRKHFKFADPKLILLSDGCMPEDSLSLFDEFIKI